jgi:putative FmdB family regulatory protein
MPLYEYRCKSCGNRFELMQKMEERGCGVCPGCGGTELASLLSVFGVASGSSSSASGEAACGPESCVCGRFGGETN